MTDRPHMIADTRIPRWMRLAMPEDVAQIAALVDWMYRTPAQRAEALRYELRELRRTLGASALQARTEAFRASPLEDRIGLSCRCGSPQTCPREGKP